MPLFRPGKPRCRLRRTTDQVFAAGFQTITWEVADYDDVGGWDGTSGYVVDRGGFYLLLARVGRTAQASAQSLIIAPAINGVRQADSRVGNSTGTVLGGTTSDLLELDYLDVITIQAQGSSSTAWTAQGIYTAFQLTRVGPIAWT